MENDLRPTARSGPIFLQKRADIQPGCVSCISQEQERKRSSGDSDGAKWQTCATIESQSTFQRSSALDVTFVGSVSLRILLANLQKDPVPKYL
jgi:hypothetical protein